MPFLQLLDSRYPLRPGSNRVGWGADLEVSLPPVDGAHPGTAAVVTLEATTGAAVRPVSATVSLELNGVPVNDPTPLLHGDRLTLAGHPCRYGDETLLGETVTFERDPDAPIATPSPTARASRSAGRLHSLVDGREYPIGDRGLTIGRDPACDVVIPAQDVSRQHAAIRKTGGGYVLLDTSANGVTVNGARVLSELPLGRGDNLRIGHEEFRFHAEEGDVTEESPVPSLAHTGTFAAARRPTGIEPASPPRPVLAYLEITNEGPSKGTRHDITLPRVEIGRGQQNDVVLQDESVSDIHAKLQRRDDAWWLVDMDSTNGTYVRGTRLTEEVAVTPGAEVRFGGIKAIFRVTGVTARPSGETRVIVGVRGPDPKRSEARLKELAEHASAAAEVPSRRGNGVIWIVLTVIVALISYFIWRARGL